MADFTNEELARLKSMGFEDLVNQINPPAVSEKFTRLDYSKQTPDDIRNGKEAPIDKATILEDLGIGLNTAKLATQNLGTQLAGQVDQTFSGNKNANSIVADQMAAMAKVSNDELNPNQQNAVQTGQTGATVAQTVGGVVPMAAATIATGGVGAGVMAGLNTKTEVYKQRMEQLAKEGVTGDKAITDANNAADIAGLQSGAVNGILGGTAKFSGQGVAEKVLNSVNPTSKLASAGIGALAGGATDAIVNGIAGGPLNELIESSNAGRDFNNHKATEDASAGAIFGGILGSIFGAHGGLSHANAMTATKLNYQNHEIVSAPLTEEGANRRASMLSHNDGAEHEVLQAVNPDGSMNNRFVVAKRTTPETEIKPDSLLDSLKTQENQRVKEQATQQEISNTNKDTALNTLHENDIQLGSPEDIIGKAKDTIRNEVQQDAQIKVQSGEPISAISEVAKGETQVKEISSRIEPQPEVQPLKETVEAVNTPEQIKAEATKTVAPTDSQVSFTRPELREQKDIKLNDGLENSRVIKDKEGNSVGLQLKSTIARPEDYHSANNGIDHTGNQIAKLDELFKAGVNKVQLVPEPNYKYVETTGAKAGQTIEVPHALKIVADGKTVGMVSDHIAKQLSPLLESGAVKSLHAEIHGERIPNSDRTSGENLHFPEDGSKPFRPILDIKASTSDIHAQDLPNVNRPEDVAKFQNKGLAKEPEVKKSISGEDDFISQTASKHVGADVNMMTGEELSAVFKQAKEKVQADIEKTFKPVLDDLKTLHNDFDKDMDMVVLHGDNSYSIKGDDNSVKYVKEFFQNEQNAKGTNGFYAYDPETGRGVSVVNLKAIAEQMKNPDSMISSIGNLQDASKFVLFHEALGHGAIDKYFPTVEAKNAWLEKMHEDSQIVRDLSEIKAKLGYDPKDISGLVEEVMADMPGGYINAGEKGKFHYEKVEDYLAKYQDKPELLTEFLNAIKKGVNAIFGKEIFKIKEGEVANFREVLKQMKEISESTKDSPYIKAKNDYLLNKDIPDVAKDFTMKFANNPTAARFDGEISNDRLKIITDASKAFFGDRNFTTKVNGFRDPQWRALSDKVYGDGWRMIQEMLQNKQRYTNQVLSHLNLIKKLNPESEKAFHSLVNEQRINKKPFTEAELTAKNVPSDVKTMYIKTDEARIKAIDLVTKSKLVGLGIKEGIIDNTNHASYKKIDNYTTEQLRDLLAKESETKFNDFKKENKFSNSMIDLIANGTNDKNSGVLRRLSSGDHYLHVKDANGKLVKFEQYKSETKRNSDLKTLQEKNGDNFKYEKGSIPKDSQELKDYDSSYNKLLREADDAALPANIPELLDRFFNSKGSEISSNIWNKHFDNYTSSIAEKGNISQAGDLRKQMDFVNKPDNKIAGTAKKISRFLSMAMSIPTAIGNISGVAMNTTPYLMSHGGAHNVPLAFALATKLEAIHATKALSGGLHGEELVKAISESGIFSKHDPVEVKAAVNEMLQRGIIHNDSNFNFKDMKKEGTSVADRAMDGAMYLSAASDRIAAHTSIVAALATGLEKGMKGDELHNFGQDGLFKTQGYYGKAGVPLNFQSPVGQIMWQFKTFGLSTVELLSHLAKNSPGSAATMALTMIGVVGAGGLPFVSNVADIYDAIAKMMGDKGSDIRDTTRKAIRGVLGEHAGNLLMYGGASDYGIQMNMASRLGYESLIPGTNIFDENNKDKSQTLAQAVGGASGANVVKTIQAVNDYFKGDNRKAVFDIAPSSLKNLIQGIEAIQTGTFKDVNNKVLTKADTTDGWMKILGSDPHNLAKVNRANEELGTKKDNIDNQKSIIYKQLATSILNKDPDARAFAYRQLSIWNKNNPENPLKIDSSTLKDMIKSAKEDAFVRNIKSDGKNMSRSVIEAFKD